MGAGGAEGRAVLGAPGVPLEDTTESVRVLVLVAVVTSVFELFALTRIPALEW